MKLSHGIHFGYCTNIHRGETWAETLASLASHTSRVRQAVAPGQPYGIGLRLSVRAARELAQGNNLDRFRSWLDRENSYVFTLNGFPYGSFHGTKVKEHVFSPDWTSAKRLEYTCLLFDLLVELLPPDCSGSVSTLPGSFKGFLRRDGQVDVILANLLKCHRHIEWLRQRTGRDLHLGLEPEPLGLIETTPETIRFFERLANAAEDPGAVLRNVGVTYDTCHLAVQFEEARQSLTSLTKAGIRLSKVHLSSALALNPTEQSLALLDDFTDAVYLHQVVSRSATGQLRRFRDLDEALLAARTSPCDPAEEWRVHFHIPLHTAPQSPFRDTRSHIEGTLDWLKKNPAACQCLEMETYTWEVLPPAFRAEDVVRQLIREYEWTLGALRTRKLA